MSGKPALPELDAVVLAGGDSRCMGSDKATLPFRGTTLVDAVAGVLAPMFRRVLVIAREPGLVTSANAEILTDDRPLHGPLVGLARGLAHSGAPWCFVTACDMPFVQPAVVLEMAAHLGDCDAVVPENGGRLQYLHAFYSQSCLPRAEALLEQGSTSLRALLSQCEVTQLDEDIFRHLPNAGQSFLDLDTTEEYRSALDDPSP